MRFEVIPKPLLVSPPPIPNPSLYEYSTMELVKTWIIIASIVLIFLALIDASINRCFGLVYINTITEEDDQLDIEPGRQNQSFIVSNFNHLDNHHWLMEIITERLKESSDERREKRLRALDETLPLVEYVGVEEEETSLRDCAICLEDFQEKELCRIFPAVHPPANDLLRVVATALVTRVSRGTPPTTALFSATTRSRRIPPLLYKVHRMVKRKQISNDDEDLMQDDEMDLIDEEDFESESEDEDGDIKLSEPSKTAIFNREEILEKLNDISWPKDVPWIHKLSIDIDQEKEVDVNDDLARELVFYTQALEGTRQAFGKLESMGFPFLRPPDYYAEMVKTDAHMVKVKGRLLSEKKKIEEAEERRKARESKKLSKEIQSEKQKARIKQKKDEIESVKKWRKQRQQSGFAGGKDGADVDLPFEDDTQKSFSRAKKQRPGVAPGDRSGGKRSQMMKKGVKGQKSREFKDSKFGFGGRKSLKKQNTADTTNDLKGFNQRSSGGSKKRK
ncbi:hypothetical protein ACFE04_007596 [Oxalis oulophora]